METASLLTEQVRQQYETFPYPNYPLLLALRWQEGFRTSSLFASRLYAQRFGRPSAIFNTVEPRILIAGCGEVLPYIIRHWEPRSHQVEGVDLSARSLKRARVRLLRCLSAVQLWHSDLESYCRQQHTLFQHIDAYGVLHHTANPTRLLQELIHKTAPGGTIRLMVYNSQARDWIHQMQRAFKLLGLDPYQTPDRHLACRILKALAHLVPSFGEKMTAMGPIFKKDAHFVDTFFHAREARISIDDWRQAWQAQGMEFLGLWDRYEELDHLANPLSWASLDEIKPYLPWFENNFEIWLGKPHEKKHASTSGAKGLNWLASFTPPTHLRQSDDTKRIAWPVIQRIWWRYLSSIKSDRPVPLDDLMSYVPIRGWQRLARMGCVFSDQFQTRLQRDRMNDPMCRRINSKLEPTHKTIEQADLKAELEKHLGRQLSSPKDQIFLMRCLRACQVGT